MRQANTTLGAMKIHTEKHRTNSRTRMGVKDYKKKGKIFKPIEGVSFYNEKTEQYVFNNGFTHDKYCWPKDQKVKELKRETKIYCGGCKNDPYIIKTKAQTDSKEIRRARMDVLEKKSRN